MGYVGRWGGSGYSGGGGHGGSPLVYMGAWDANANVPPLASGVGVQGQFYIVSVAGTTNLDGITDWYVGDWAVFDGTVWQQIDNSENPLLYNVRFLAGNGTLGLTDTVIEFTASGTLTLDAAPINGRTIWVRRNYVGAAYTISGNGKLIEGAATLPMPVNADSMMLVYDGFEWRIFARSGLQLAASPLWFGAGDVGATTTARFLYPGYDDGLAQTIAVRYRITHPGTLRNLRVRHNVTAGNGNAIVYTVQINGVSTLLSVSLASTATDGSDLADLVPVVAGDLIAIVVTKAVAVAASPTDVTAILDLVP